jgi:hypothetical protein
MIKRMEFFEIHIATSRNQIKDRQSKTGKQSEGHTPPLFGEESRITKTVFQRSFVI